MDYIEIIAKVSAENREQAEAIAIMLSDGGIYTEDYSDIVTVAPAVGKTEYIASELLEQDRANVQIHLYLSPLSNGAQVAAELRERLERAGIGCKIEVSGVTGADWENSWKEFYRPVEVGHRLLVCPAWQREEQPSRKTLLIDPGMAFGSGLHATTQLAAARLEQVIKPGDEVLDMGCGSGILGIAAMLFGAVGVWAADISAAAVEAAQTNARLNGVEKGFSILPTGDALRKKDYDIIVANIVADVIISYAEGFFGSLKPGGYLITSGIISGREAETKSKLESAGFVFFGEGGEGEWHEITFIKPQAGE